MGDVVQTMQPRTAAAVQRCLVRKLAEVMGEVDRIPKSGTNTFHNYSYATEADIVAAVRGGMARRALMLIPDVERTDWREGPIDKSGKPKRICSLTVRFVLEDGESGETREFRVMGEGDGSDDKATYKAMTGAIKYALLKLFLIPTGDDPEHDAPDAKAGPADARKQIWGEKPAEAPKAPAYVIKFGNNKGKTPAELPDSDLAWHLKKAAEDVAKKDPKWHAKNVEALRAMEAETARRKSAPAAMASPNAAPKDAGPDEFPMHYMTRKLEARGIDRDNYGPIVKERMGTRSKIKEWTWGDTAAVFAKFPEPPDDAPPPPSDADAPQEVGQ